MVARNVLLARFGFVGAFFRTTQIIEQLPPFADVDPATDDALHFAARVTVRENPVIDRQPASTDVQFTIENQGCALGHDALIVGLIFPGFEGVAHSALNDTFANDVFAFCTEGLQVAVIAALEQTLAITYINRMWRAVDQ